MPNELLKNSRVYFTLTVVSKFARFEALQHVRNIAIEGVQNTHHWSGPIDGIAEFAGLEYAGLENDGLANDGLENDGRSRRGGMT